jgi:hypothetical protein
MDLTGLVKSLALPPGFAPPRELAHDDMRATVLSRVDLDDDVRAINENVDLIARTRGGGWPTGPVTAEEDYQDLVWHELEFRDGYSYSYTVRHEDGRYLGCCYLYPVGRRVALTEELLRHDVDVSWWVTGEGYEQGYYEKLHAALARWVVTDYPFRDPYWSNREVPGAGGRPTT